MNTRERLEYIRIIQEHDERVLKEADRQICPQCMQNRPIGLHPFWHAYRRSLCEACGTGYAEVLKGMGAWMV